MRTGRERVPDPIDNRFCKESLLSTRKPHWKAPINWFSGSEWPVFEGGRVRFRMRQRRVLTKSGRLWGVGIFLLALVLGPGSAGKLQEFSDVRSYPAPLFLLSPRYPLLRESASGPEIGLPGWKSGFRAGFRPDSNRENIKIGPSAGRRADFEACPSRIRPTPGPDDRFPARKHFCVT